MARRRLSAKHKAAIARSLQNNNNGQGNRGKSRGGRKRQQPRKAVRRPNPIQVNLKNKPQKAKWSTQKKVVVGAVATVATARVLRAGLYIASR